MSDAQQSGSSVEDPDPFGINDPPDDEYAATPLPKWDYVGRCYNILTLDPLNLGGSALAYLAFDFPPGDFKNTPDKSHSHPRTTRYTPGGGGSLAKSSSMMSTVYDFKRYFGSSISVSAGDPTGKIFSGSLSNSVAKTSNDLQSHQNTISYSDGRIVSYKLEIAPVLAEQTLGQDLGAALASLPAAGATDDPAFASFFEQFGTHFSRAATIGGRAYQRIVLSRSSYNRFVESKVDVKASVSATFAGTASAQAAAEADKKVSSDFKSAIENRDESVQYEGGTPQEYFDMWAMYVNDNPAPIELGLAPLSELITTELLIDVDPSEIAGRQAALTAATAAYLEANGHDVSGAILSYGDSIELVCASNDGSRRLVDTDASAVKLVSPDSAGGDRCLWQLVDPRDTSNTAQISAADPIALRSPRLATFLDAAAGRNDRYDAGDGLCGCTGSEPTATSAIWQTARADGADRSELVTDDYVHLRTAWVNPDGDKGLLMADDANAVYSFGDNSTPNGTIWMLRKHDA